MSDKEKKMEHRKPTTAYGIFSLALVLLVCLGASNFLNAPIKGMFFVAWLVIIPLCMYLGYSYNEIWEGMMEYCKKGLGYHYSFGSRRHYRNMDGLRCSAKCDLFWA